MRNNKFTRGVRNNNPANIRKGSNWLGLCAVQKDSAFCQFVSMPFGIRALLVLLRTYRNKYDKVTLREIIHRFAPPTENNTWEYLVFVRNWLKSYYDGKGFKVDVDFDMCINLWYNSKQPGAYLYPLCAAICQIESRYELTQDMYDKAVKLL